MNQLTWRKRASHVGWVFFYTILVLTVGRGVWSKLYPNPEKSRTTGPMRINNPVTPEMRGIWGPRPNP